jgi:hypothetical protein
MQPFDFYNITVMRDIVDYLRLICHMFHKLDVFPPACGLGHFLFSNWMVYKGASLKLCVLFAVLTLLCSKFQHRKSNVEKQSGIYTRVIGKLDAQK